MGCRFYGAIVAMSLCISVGLVACSEQADLNGEKGSSNQEAVDMSMTRDDGTSNGEFDQGNDQGGDQGQGRVTADLGRDMDEDLGDAGGGEEEDMGGAPRPPVITGRFESAGPVRTCGAMVSWDGPDGVLLRPNMSTCGEDLEALSATIVANLDVAAQKGSKVMLIVGQGLSLPESWLQACERFQLQSERFSGESCAPWDPSYQAALSQYLKDSLGPAVKGHEALAGVYFTISTMTNGSELHFRANRDIFDPYPGDETMRQAYLDVMDIFQEAFEVPVVFEAGHCLWLEEEDCETPLEMYRHARDTYGPAQTGVAMWNCAERFFVSERSPEFHTRPLFEEATRDGVSIGCQTVGSFEQACRFSSEEVANYGTPPMGPGMRDCPDSSDEDREQACVDTMSWFVGKSSRNAESMSIRGTWGELWSGDLRAGGVYQTSEKCREAIDALSRQP